MLCMENFPQAVLALVFLCLEGGSLVVAQCCAAWRGMVGMAWGHGEVSLLWGSNWIGWDRSSSGIERYIDISSG